MVYKGSRSEFPDDVVNNAWRLSESRCQCTRSNHNHPYGRCPQKLIFSDRGREISTGWEAHHINSNGPDTLSNCEILCIDCHKRTRSYGGN